MTEKMLALANVSTKHTKQWNVKIETGTISGFIQTVIKFGVNLIQKNADGHHVRVNLIKLVQSDQVLV